MKNEIPVRLVRAMQAEIEVDVEKRILKRAQFVTRKIASDGGIVIPDGINLKFFEQNPVVMYMHGRAASSGKFPVVGRSLSVVANELGMMSETQFADTELGREIAYLYGVNPGKEVYARGFSFGWETTEREVWTLETAKAWLGKDYDEGTTPDFVKRYNEVWVSKRSIMNEYSVVPLGADRDAISRAFIDANNRTAGLMLADMDLDLASRKLAEIEEMHGADRVRLGKLEQDIQALRRDGASAAARGDSEAVLRQAREMVDQLNEMRIGV